MTRTPESESALAAPTGRQSLGRRPLRRQSLGVSEWREAPNTLELRKGHRENQ